MGRYQIAVVVGSLRKESLNRKLAFALAKMAPTDFEFKQLRIDNLPLYNQDDDAHPDDAVIQMKRDILASQGVLFVTPEYNRSIPGVLKNALDHGSRPWGQNAWAGKPAGVVGVSIGSLGTALAQTHLRSILSFFDMPTVGQPEAFLYAKEGFFDENGDINEGSRKFLQAWTDTFVNFIKTHADL